MYLNFCIYFFAWYSYRNNEFCNRIKNLRIGPGIKKNKSISNENDSSSFFWELQKSLNPGQVIALNFCNLSHSFFPSYFCYSTLYIFAFSSSLCFFYFFVKKQMDLLKLTDRNLSYNGITHCNFLSNFFWYFKQRRIFIITHIQFPAFV